MTTSGDDHGKGMSRRGFLRATGASASAAAAVSVAALAPAAAEPPPGGQRREAGYQETAHVRRVYALARF